MIPASFGLACEPGVAAETLTIHMEGATTAHSTGRYEHHHAFPHAVLRLWPPVHEAGPCLRFHSLRSHWPLFSVKPVLHAAQAVAEPVWQVVQLPAVHAAGVGEGQCKAQWRRKTCDG